MVSRIASVTYTPVTDERDKALAALEGLITGQQVGDVRPASSIQEAYGAFFRPAEAWSIDPWQIQAAIFGRQMGASGQITESIDTSTWSAAFRDSMTKRAIAAYRIPEREAWRKVVSEISDVSDFKTQRRFRVGGYNTLATVGEASPYPPLTTPTDEEVTWPTPKRGGVESISLEAIANGDKQTIRQVADNCGVAAWLTLHRAIFIGLLVSNPAIYDSVTLFHATHGNTDSGAALAAGTLNTGRQKMRSQARPGETDGALSIRPKLIVVPNELEDTAFRLTTSPVAVSPNQNATEPNINQGLEAIVIDEFTDSDDWFLVANPALIPTIEVGFLNGRQDPEIIIADDPTEGSAFTADVIPVKVRHVWGLAVLDYRGFYRAQG
jgi:hypothetical protein